MLQHDGGALGAGIPDAAVTQAVERAMSALLKMTTLFSPSPAAMCDTPLSLQISRRARLIRAAMAPIEIGAAATMAGACMRSATAWASGASSADPVRTTRMPNSSASWSATLAKRSGGQQVSRWRAPGCTQI